VPEQKKRNVVRTKLKSGKSDEVISQKQWC